MLGTTTKERISIGTNVSSPNSSSSAATLLEANSKKSDTAVLVVLVFKKRGCFSDVKIRQNNDDIDTFLKSINAFEYNDCYAVPTSYGKQNGIRFYFKKIEIDVT